MKLAQVRSFALSLAEATEEPHFEYSSFRVRGKIFVTAPPGGQYVHVFAREEHREPVLAMCPEFVEKLIWGKRVVGVRIALARALPSVVKQLVLRAWEAKAPKSLTQETT